jgi:hypothetical protein
MSHVIAKHKKKIIANNMSQINIASPNEISGTQLFIVCLNIGSNSKETWYLTYSASNDMKPHKEWFMTIKHLIIPCLYVWEMIVPNKPMAWKCK